MSTMTNNINKITRTYRVEESILKRISGLNCTERRSCISWLSRQGEAVQIEAVRLQHDLLRIFKNNQRFLPIIMRYDVAYRAEIDHAHLILTAVKMMHAESQLKRRSELNTNLDEIQDYRVARIRAKRKDKASPKRTKFKKLHYQLVKQLRENKGLTWREIQGYLESHNQVKYGYSWICTMYLKIKQELTLAGVTDIEIP